MSNESQIIGQIVETLIGIKDRYSEFLLKHEIDAINDACNILDNRFNRFNTADELINNHITSIHWQIEDIKTALIEDGFIPDEDNVNTVVSHPGFEKYLQEHGIEAGWDIIHNTISELKDELREE